jgi:hypothetical protein
MTLVPVTRCTTNVLAANHTDKLLDLRNIGKVTDDELRLVRLGLNPYPQAWPRIHN